MNYDKRTIDKLNKLFDNLETATKNSQLVWSNIPTSSNYLTQHDDLIIKIALARLDCIHEIYIIDVTLDCVESFYKFSKNEQLFNRIDALYKAIQTSKLSHFDFIDRANAILEKLNTTNKI